MSEAGGANGSASSAVAALQRTHESLNTIRDRLAPFLQLAASTEAEADERALAQAAIALSIATLRVVGHRLRGQDRGKAPDDPLRQELNRIRAALQEANAKCKAKQKEREGKPAPESSSASETSVEQTDRLHTSQLPSSPSHDAKANKNKRKQDDDESALGDRGDETSPLGKQEPSSASKKPRTG